VEIVKGRQWLPDFSQSNFAARLQNIVSRRREESGLYSEIAEKIQLTSAHHLLDVGTGSGLQLKVIHELEPSLELYGLDLSEASILVAKKNLKRVDVDLRVGSIENTSYEDNFFDVVTCNSSMSYWKNLQSCFDEIYRILKPGAYARLFEPQNDFDIDQVVKTIRENMAGESWLRRTAAVALNKYALTRGQRVGLKLYSLEELEKVARQSRFGDHIKIERTTLQKLPIFLQITLLK
jgi:ubiquinone/menaquinone biosynthesis C-methylase UbiE